MVRRVFKTVKGNYLHVDGRKAEVARERENGRGALG